MRLVSLILILVLGAAIGLGLTWVTTMGGYGPGVVHAGAWKFWPKIGTEDADPYARAALARGGELPLELADGLAFTATADDAGQPLDGRCEIRLSGNIPQARFWTLTVTDAEGRMIENNAARNNFTSAEVVWGRDGSLDIVLGPRAHAGNWLPTAGTSRIGLTLRLYDTSVGLATRASDAPEMPRLRTERCS